MTTATTAERYLLRKKRPPSEQEPERLTESDALKIIVSATAGAACPSDEVGPVANHIAGPVAAIPPEGHPDWSDLRSAGGSLRTPRAVNDLIMEACGLVSQNEIRCRCDGTLHPITVIMRHLSQGRMACAHVNSSEAQQRIVRAMESADVDHLIYQLEPRLDALKMLVDRARAEYGGDLPEVVIEAAVLLAQTLTGPTRWDVRTGYNMYEWPVRFRIGQTWETADSIMKQDFIHDAVIRRLINGA